MYTQKVLNNHLLAPITPTIRPTVKQHQAYSILGDKETNYLFFGGGAGGGKSWLGCEWLITSCYFYPGTKWYIGREELKRLMSSSFLTFNKVMTHHTIPREDWKLNGQYNFIEFRNGSRIDLLDLKYLPTDPLYERLGSLEYTGGWIEEAGEVEFLAFDVLKTRIGRHLNKDYNLIPKKLITCNPKKNWIYSYVYRPWKESKLPKEYRFIQSLYSDNPHTAKEYQQQLESVRDTQTKERLMFGNWEYDDDPSALIEYDAILDLWTNRAELGSKFITFDTARFGSDTTRIILWDGFKILKHIKLVKKDTTVVANTVRTLAWQEAVPYSHIVGDDDGVGGGVIDQLKGIKGFVNNSRPLENPQTHKVENFENLKTQCYYLLADYVNNHRIEIEGGVFTEEEKKMLIEELEQVKRRDADKDGKLKIKTKDEVKETIGRSPDISDAIMMRMFFLFGSQTGQAGVYYPQHKFY